MTQGKLRREEWRWLEHWSSAQLCGEDLSWSTCRILAWRSGVEGTAVLMCDDLSLDAVVDFASFAGENKHQTCFVHDNVEYRRAYVDKCECVWGVSFIDSFSHFSFHSFAHCGTYIPS